MKIDSDAIQNRKELVGAEKYKHLYHYTSFDSFVKIWLNQNLKFSPLSKVNDIQEAFFEAAVVNSDRVELAQKLVEERLSYKQISFTMDYDSYFKGCMSTMMWGTYADKSNGVCIELDYEKIHFPENVIKGIVNYEPILTLQHIVDDNIESEEEFQTFFREHQDEYFFFKQKDWAGENEYRVLAKGLDYLDIGGAIKAVYVTSFCSDVCLLVEKLVDGKVPVNLLWFIRTFDNWAIPIIRDAKEERLRREILAQRKKD